MTVIHHMTPEQIQMVEESVATLTPDGWVLPGFLVYLWAGVEL